MAEPIVESQEQADTCDRCGGSLEANKVFRGYSILVMPEEVE